LRSRGVQGILVPPLRQPVDCSDLVDWSQFSVVAATYTAQNMQVNRVLPNHLQVGYLALNKLESRGYKRIGLVTEPNDHARVSHAFLAALALHQQAGRSAPIPAIQLGDIALMRDWIRTHRPEVILTTEVRLGLIIAETLAGAKLGAPPIILLNHPRDPRFDGVYQHPEIVGRRAVDLLASQIQLGERGDSAHPNILMVEGSWLKRTRF
jgi:DNA-binding LacI/PurR family transcriptional regulator